MRDHPTPTMLDRFLRGDLAPEEVRFVLGHLLQGCANCRTRIAPAVEALLSGAPLPVAEEIPDAAYDLAIEKVIRDIRMHGADAFKIKAATRKAHARLLKKGSAEALTTSSWRDIPDQAIFEALLQRAHELRHEDPQQMVFFSALAMWKARLFQGREPRDLADLNARGLTEYANALRVADKLGEATTYLDLADRSYQAGTGDLVLGLRLKDVRASLYGAQEHYAAAMDLAGEVARERLRIGDRQGAATALVQKAVYTGYAGELEEELRLLEEAGALAEGKQGPALDALLLRNKLYVLVELERAGEAFSLLEQNRSSLWKWSGRMDRCRLLDIEGRIHAALGRLELAELLLAEGKQGFKEAGVAGHEALLGLNLASVILGRDRNRYGEAAALAVEALETFSKLGVQPQVEDALLVLSDALREGLVSATLLQSVADFVRRAEHDRKARYQPRFE